MTNEKYCARCQGAGQVDTGIIESPVTICNDCNGTGLAQQRTWVGLTDEEHTNIQKQADYNQFMSASEFAARCQALVEAKLREKNNA